MKVWAYPASVTVEADTEDDADDQIRALNARMDQEWLQNALGASVYVSLDDVPVVISEHEDEDEEDEDDPDAVD